MIALGGLSGPPAAPLLLGGNPPIWGPVKPPERGEKRADLEVDLYPGATLQNIFSKKISIFQTKNELTSKLICTLASVYKYLELDFLYFPNQNQNEKQFKTKTKTKPKAFSFSFQKQINFIFALKKNQKTIPKETQNKNRGCT